MSEKSNSPAILANIGDGKQRRFFLGGDELRQIERDAGRGFFSLYINFHQDAHPREVAAVLRLALIGGGEDPRQADEVVSYYATPPRPLQHAYSLAFDCLNAAWVGSEKHAQSAKAATAAEMDGFFVTVEAALLKAGLDTGVLKGKSFAEIQALFAAMSKDDDKPAAPDADAFEAIKQSIKKGKK